MLLDFQHLKMLRFDCKECGDGQMQISSSQVKKRCNDLIDENDHKHLVEGEVCNIEDFYTSGSTDVFAGFAFASR